MSDVPGHSIDSIPSMADGRQIATIADLERWFSPERMGTYVRSAKATDCDPVELYVWNGRLSKALLEDIAHVEVLLRNFIANRLATDCGHEDWYHDNERYHFSTTKSTKFADSISEIERNIKFSGKTVTPSRVIGGMMLGSWCFLLTSRLEQTVWRALLRPSNGGMPHYQLRKRAIFERHVKMMRDLRNRLSHQEHIVLDSIANERQYLDQQSENLDWIANAIYPQAADWIRSQSRVPELRLARPQTHRRRQ